MCYTYDTSHSTLINIFEEKQIFFINYQIDDIYHSGTYHRIVFCDPGIPVFGHSRSIIERSVRNLAYYDSKSFE